LTDSSQDIRFVDWFRNSAPYIHAFRGRIFVIAFDGDAVASPGFASFIHDVALLNSLGVRLVLVHGARPQIEERLKARGAQISYVNGLRVTDDPALVCVKEAAGAVRVEIEALLSMGLANSPMAGAKLRVASGNFVTARPLGVREGVDYQHTGEVRRIDVSGIEQRLEHKSIVLLSPLGYSPTGEVFNISAEDIASAAAVQLQADKLVFLCECRCPADSRRRLIRQLSVAEAENYLQRRKRIDADLRRHLQSAIHACRHGVRRVHLIERHIDGGVLQELFSRDGVGTMITDDPYDGVRQATIEDVGGILELIEPLEAEGVLVRRSRELLEMEIGHFIVMERDGMIIGCAALYPCSDAPMAELACLAVRPDYRNQGRGERLLDYLETRARHEEIDQLFVLTTRTAHWFRERGFRTADLGKVPLKKRSLYNYQRNSKIFLKDLGD
jgi:amino-acid N-acetyltransferase